VKTRAAVLHEQARPRPYASSRPMTVETLDIDGPRENEVLIEMVAAGLCHSDLSTIEGSRPRRLPTVLGHEGAGVVVEVGPGVDDIRAGDHVVLGPVIACGTCRDCLAGRPALCAASKDAKTNGVMLDGTHRLHWNGRDVFHTSGVSCFSEYAVAPKFSVVAVDRGIPLDDAALFGCAVMTGVGAVVNTARVAPGATMAVVGLGGVGLSAVLGGRVAGAQRIVAIDVHDEKLDLARRLGATDTFNARDPDCAAAVRDATDGGVDFAFESSGAAAALTTAYAAVRRGGSMITTSLPPTDAEFAFNIYDLVAGEKTVRGCYMGTCVPRRDIPRFLALYERGLLPVAGLKSGLLRLDEINEGFDRLADGRVARQVIDFRGTP
jgi:alcohol dehydrogenase